MHRPPLEQDLDTIGARAAVASCDRNFAGELSHEIYERITANLRDDVIPDVFSSASGFLNMIVGGRRGWW